MKIQLIKNGEEKSTEETGVDAGCRDAGLDLKFKHII
jgi:hypothetical protein